MCDAIDMPSLSDNVRNLAVAACCAQRIPKFRCHAQVELCFQPIQAELSCLVGRKWHSNDHAIPIFSVMGKELVRAVQGMGCKCIWLRSLQNE